MKITLKVSPIIDGLINLCILECKSFFFLLFILSDKILYLSKIIKPLNDIYFEYKKLKFNKACFTRPFLMSKSNLSNKKSNKIFIHHKLIKDRDPENILLKELSKKNDFLKNYRLN